LGQNSAPEAAPIVDSIPPARDEAWAGVIALSVDTTDNTRGIFRVTETIPVAAAGPLTLLYPKWIPGTHTDCGTLSQLAGLELSAGGHALAWRRDAVDLFAFHVDVPAGAGSVEARFQYLAPSDGSQGRIVTTPDMLNLQWHTVALYPAGHYVRRIQVEASVKLPEGWKAATALEVASQRGVVIHFKQTALDTLVDSPIFAGANVRVETLAPGVRLNIVADQGDELAASAEQIQYHRDLVAQAVKLFGSQHYDHYDFLLSCSDRQGAIGLEHHRSSENGVTGNYFTHWEEGIPRHYLLAHEYTHSWNGKFRRPADLWTADYRTPMRCSLLWVYEGQTHYWGYVLAARCGMLSKEETLGGFASLAARLEVDPGRTWRPLEDTTDDLEIALLHPKTWRSWQRDADYYNESLLIWLDADSLIRELSHGARSLDDFARTFFGVRDRDWGELTYTFDDVVHALNETQPYDWAAFLHTRLDHVNHHAPLDGITRGGYRLVYSETPTAWFTSFEKARKITDLTYSGGFVLGKDGEVTEVEWDSAAFKAGLTAGCKIVAVNNRALDIEELKDAIKAKKSPLSLLVRTGDVYRTTELRHDGGLRYPKLERTGKGPCTLDAILAAKP
jgi:predicted metalloprotease with PDZ domain